MIESRQLDQAMSVTSLMQHASTQSAATEESSTNGGTTVQLQKRCAAATVTATLLWMRSYAASDILFDWLRHSDIIDIQLTASV